MFLTQIDFRAGETDYAYLTLNLMSSISNFPSHEQIMNFLKVLAEEEYSTLSVLRTENPQSIETFSMNIDSSTQLGTIITEILKNNLLININNPFESLNIDNVTNKDGKIIGISRDGKVYEY